MTQEQLKQQVIDYITNNLNNKTALEVIDEILENIANEIYYEDYKKQANQLTTASLIIEDVINHD